MIYHCFLVVGRRTAFEVDWLFEKTILFFAGVHLTLLAIGFLFIHLLLLLDVPVVHPEGLLFASLLDSSHQVCLSVDGGLFQEHSRMALVTTPENTMILYEEVI